MPRFSVLMPTHDRADVVGHAIDSVLRQTEGDFELLIVGDGCTDETAEVVAGFDDKRIRWYDLPKAPHYGYANRNIALREAKGDLIAFAAHDDLLFPDHLELLANAIDETGVEWIYSRPLWVSTDGLVVPYCTNLNNPDEMDRFHEANTIPASCVVHRSSCFNRSGYWPEDIPAGADWQFWIRIINDGKRTNFGYLTTATTLHFSADWKKSRYCGVPEVKTLLEVCDTASWWPASLKYAVSASQIEQEVVFAAMTAGGPDWSRQVRMDVESVVNRLAWDAVRYTRPQCNRQAAEIAAMNRRIDKVHIALRQRDRDLEGKQGVVVALQASLRKWTRLAMGLAVVLALTLATVIVLLLI